MSNSDEVGAGGAVTPVNDGHAHALRAAFLSGDVMTRYWGTAEELVAAAKKKSKKKPAKKPAKKKEPARKRPKPTKRGAGCGTLNTPTCTCSNGCGSGH